MCGIFAFFGSRADPELLTTVAEEASRRGGHGYGFAGRDRHARGSGRPFAGELETFYERGPIVGHFRLATSSLAVARIEDLQPIVVPGAIVAHNGNVPGYDELRRRYRLQTECDSEVLAIEIAERGIARAWSLVADVPHAIVVLTGTHAYAARSRLPLHVAERPEGVYLCSRRFPGAEPLPEGGIRAWTGFA